MAKQMRRKSTARPVPQRRKAAKPGKGADDGVYLVVPGRKEPIYLNLGTDRAEVERLALKWSYSLRNRERWVGRPDLLESHRAEIKEVAAAAGTSSPSCVTPG